MRTRSTGALTNVAMMLKLFPDVARMISIVLMGGAYGLGNTGPVSEFNIQTDPEAARVVFAANTPLAMVPLEVTHTALVTTHVLDRLGGSKNRGALNGAGAGAGAGAKGNGEGNGEGEGPSTFRGTLRELLTFFESSYREHFGFAHPPLHDPCAVALCLDARMFTWERICVDIDTSDTQTAGQTICDVVSGTEPSASHGGRSGRWGSAGGESLDRVSLLSFLSFPFLSFPFLSFPFPFR